MSEDRRVVKVTREDEDRYRMSYSDGTEILMNARGEEIGEGGEQMSDRPWTVTVHDMTAGGLQATYGVGGSQSGPDVEAGVSKDRAFELADDLSHDGWRVEFGELEVHAFRR